MGRKEEGKEKVGKQDEKGDGNEKDKGKGGKESRTR